MASCFIKTCFHVDDSTSCDHIATYDLYVPMSRMYGIRVVGTSNKWLDAGERWALTRQSVCNGNAKECMAFLHDIVLNPLLEAASQCGHVDEGNCAFFKGDGVACPILDQLMPLYGLYGKCPLDDGDAKDGWFIVHPDERTRMERIVAGTDNPIHDLVHQMQYHPAFAMAAEVEDAKNDFNKRVKK